MNYNTSNIHTILDNPTNNYINMGLDSIKQILNYLDNPQNKIKVIHVTGTNGKGSVVNYIHNALKYQGYNVGKFTSPHIYKINESIIYNDREISDDELIFYYKIILSSMNKHNIKLSQFELLTVIMLLFFHEMKIDFAVIEVGMGGLLDATNVIKSPLISVITNIALEHCQFLGNTYLDIIKHKCGIIKNSEVIISDNNNELINYLETNNYKYTNVLKKYKFKTELDYSKFVTNIKLYDINNNSILETHLANFGKYQVNNFIVAYEILKRLDISLINIIKAANNTKWFGRLSIINTTPTIILDITHNTHGANALINNFIDHFSKDDIVIITSILKDKDIKEIINIFTKISNYLIITGIHNTTRGLTANEIISKLNTIPNNIQIENTPQQALELAKTFNKKIILITGSTYLLKEFNLYSQISPENI
jgi:dihydrofolate synthase/folylpolyglutamate synthase